MELYNYASQASKGTLLKYARPKTVREMEEWRVCPMPVGMELMISHCGQALTRYALTNLTR